MELNRLSACELAARLQSRSVDAEDVARAHLERIAVREPAIGAWAHLDPEQLLHAAKVLDAGPIRGPLHGLPVAVKDIIATADMPTQYGSPVYAGHRPAWDAACVALIRAAGGLICGKTVTAEFASSHPGRTVNPLNPAHTPGGSSSGSAASVADFMVPAALGTQTGGSLIRPASYCGIVGYKPSFGMINRHGVKPLSESLDTVGVMARTVRDAALLASAAAGRPALREFPAGRVERVGIWRTHEWGQAEPETVVLLEAAVRIFSVAGARITEAVMPALFAQADRAHHDIEYYEMARALAFEMQSHRAALSDALRGRLEQGQAVDPVLYDAKQAVAEDCRRSLDDVFRDHDILLGAATTGEAPKGHAATGSAAFNRSWTLMHVPCITVPAGTGPNGLPVGIQIIARRGGDARALAAAEWVEGILGG